jgi:hypothetical protein
MGGVFYCASISKFKRPNDIDRNGVNGANPIIFVRAIYVRRPRFTGQNPPVILPAGGALPERLKNRKKEPEKRRGAGRGRAALRRGAQAIL